MQVTQRLQVGGNGLDVSEVSVGGVAPVPLVVS